MSIVYLSNSTVFSYKRVLFFIGKICVVKVNLSTNLYDISFCVDKSYIKIVTSTPNKDSFKLIEDISKKINKALLDINVGFIKKITLFGIGFRSWTYKIGNGFNYLILKIGFSRDLSIKIPFAINAIILKPTLILFKSLDKNMLNQFVAFLRSLKSPDSYKGKGLRYIDEKILLKTGKA
jgi:large subunit ribosomal protein L6